MRLLNLILLASGKESDPLLLAITDRCKKQPISENLQCLTIGLYGRPRSTASLKYQVKPRPSATKPAWLRRTQNPPVLFSGDACENRAHRGVP